MIEHFNGVCKVKTINLEKFRSYYTVEQLVDRWDKSENDIVQLGTTGRVSFYGRLRYDYKSSGTHRINFSKVDPNHILSIIHSKEPFRLPEGINKEIEGYMPLGKFGEAVALSYLPGMDTLIIFKNEIEEFEKNNSVVKATDELYESERTSLLKMIWGMARDGYKHKPGMPRNTSTGEKEYSIYVACEKHGVKINKETIKKYLDQAEERFYEPRS